MQHPDLLKALAQAKQDDLVNERRHPRPSMLRFHWHGSRFHRARCQLRSLLISAGGRIIGDIQDALDLAHERHRKIDAKTSRSEEHEVTGSTSVVPPEFPTTRDGCA